MTEPLLIGVPVYNGATGIAQALEGLLSQSFEDFKVIVSDNASTDATFEIATEIAARDSRVMVIKESQNRGAMWNFNRLLGVGRQHRFFMWAAHDDRHDRDYLSKCISRLVLDANVALCGSCAQFLSTSNIPTGEIDTGVIADGPDRIARAIAYARGVQRNSLFYGVYRTSLVHATVPNCVGGDQVFLLDLALRGGLVTLPEILLSRRTGGSSRNAASLYRLAGQRSNLPARLFRIDVYRAFFQQVKIAEGLTLKERKRLRAELLGVLVRRHILKNLHPTRLLAWLRNKSNS